MFVPVWQTTDSKQSQRYWEIKGGSVLVKKERLTRSGNEPMLVLAMSRFAGSVGPKTSVQSPLHLGIECCRFRVSLSIWICGSALPLDSIPGSLNHYSPSYQVIYARLSSLSSFTTTRYLYSRLLKWKSPKIVKVFCCTSQLLCCKVKSWTLE